MKNFYTVLIIMFASKIFAQTTFATTPAYPTQTDVITIVFDVTNATHANKIAGYSGQVYAHTGVTISTNGGAPQKWQNVIGNWGNNSLQPLLKSVGTNRYELIINNPRTFYGVSDASQKITEISLVLRSADATKQSEDIFIPLFQPGISVVINQPKLSSAFGDPLRSPVFINSNSSLSISATTSEIGTKTKNLSLYINGILKTVASSRNLDFTFVANDNPKWNNLIKIVASDTANIKDSLSFTVIKNAIVKEQALPAGTDIGVNYSSDPTKVTLALYAPKKSFIYVIGDFNDWKVDSNYFMNRYTAKADSVIWWITIPKLSPGLEYSYQFFIDGKLRIQDPYTEKVLDPNNDKYISTELANAYPTGKTESITSTLKTGQSPYVWKAANYVRQGKENLVIYELLVRDFVSTHSYTTLKDTLSYFKKLGVNAIELMPVNEFEGNLSWGYNTSMYFAPDKYYGTKNQLKDFIDACHQNGIAVIIDMVLNHSFGQSPMVKMYADSSSGYPNSQNPWFNPDLDLTVAGYQARHPYNVGYDFNHESNATKYFVDRVTSFWLNEYKIDGFRFDLTKGFTQNITYIGNGQYSSDAAVSAYDAGRIKILKRMAEKIWSVDSKAFVILEHFASNTEETELASNGMMLWGNSNSNYNEATMGYHDNSKSDFSWINYQKRGWSSPNVVGYMESHDEERLMYKNLLYGNSSSETDIKNLNIALNRMKLAGAFFFTIPGPKMLWQFGELGYDVNIDFNGRTGEKPIRWNYYSETVRKNLMKVWSALINLKIKYPAFSTSTYALNVTSAVKRIWLNHSSMNVTILGNFDVVTQLVTPNFQNTGTWYDYFSGQSILVTNTDSPISLAPGEFKIYTTVKLPTPEAGILLGINDEKSIPQKFNLEQNYPNPFNPETIISYQISKPGNVSLKVFDSLGRKVATLVNEFKQPGKYNTLFSSVNYKLSSGVYFYRIQADNYTDVKKMMLMK